MDLQGNDPVRGVPMTLSQTFPHRNFWEMTIIVMNASEKIFLIFVSGQSGNPQSEN